MLLAASLWVCITDAKWPSSQKQTSTLDPSKYLPAFQAWRTSCSSAKTCGEIGKFTGGASRCRVEEKVGGRAPEVTVYLCFHVYAYFHSSIHPSPPPFQEIKPEALNLKHQQHAEQGCFFVTLTGVSIRWGYRRVISPPRQEEYYCRSNFILNILYSVMQAYLFLWVLKKDCSLFVWGAVVRMRKAAVGCDNNGFRYSRHDARQKANCCCRGDQA